MITYNEFKRDVSNLAYDLKGEYDLADALDHVHETVDGLQAVIYHAKAWDLVNMIRQYDYSLYQEAQDMLDDICIGDTDLNTLMSSMAYCIYTLALNDYLYTTGE